VRIGYADDAGVAIANVSGEFRDQSSSASPDDCVGVASELFDSVVSALFEKSFVKSVLKPDAGFWPRSGEALGKVMVNEAFSVFQFVVDWIPVELET